MPKNTSLKFLSTIFINIIMLFAANDVLAVSVCEAPECVVMGSCQIKIVKHDGKFPLIVSSANKDQYKDYAIACQEGGIGLPCAIFPYQFSGNCKYSKFAQAIPNPATYCSDALFDIAKTVSMQKWLPAGAGDVDTTYYQNDFSIRVLEWQPDLDNGQVFFIATTPNVSSHPTPTLLIQGKDLYYNTLLSVNCEVVEPLIARTETLFTFIDPEGVSHTGYYKTNQSGTEVLEVRIDDKSIPTSQWWPVSSFQFCAPDPKGQDTITLKFDKPYSCHRAVDATNEAGLVGNSPGYCPWFLNPPGIILNICPY